MSLSPEHVPGSPTTYGWSITSAGGSGSPGSQQTELTPAAPGVAGQVGDRLVDRPEAGEVVVDEEPEHAVVGAGQLAEPHGEGHRLQLALGGVPLGLAGGIAEVDALGRAQLQAQLGAGDGDRAADEAGDVLAAEAGERVDRPQRGVDRPQQGGQRRLVAGGTSGAVGGVGGDEPGGERAERLLGGTSARAAARRRAGPRGRGRSPTSRRRRPARGAARRAGRRRHRTPRGSRRDGRAGGSRRRD